MLQLAVGPFRRLEPDWPRAVLRLLRLADRRLAESRLAAALASGPAPPHLASATDGPRIGRALSNAFGTKVEVERIDLVRHKPGRRCVLRYELRVGPNGSCHTTTAYAKVFDSGRAQSVYAASLAIWTGIDAAAGGPRVARPLAVLPEHHLVLHERLSGRPVVDRLTAGDTELAAAVARALRTLHGSRVRLASKHGLDRELAPLAGRVERLADGAPASASLARACLAAAIRIGGRPWPWRYCPVHRDFYPQQVLIDRDGVGFLDLDDAATSEPAVDVANFLAHLRLERLRAPAAGPALDACGRSFLHAYRSRDPELDPALVGFLEGTTLLRLAHIHPPLARPLLEESERCLLNVPD